MKKKILFRNQKTGVSQEIVLQFFFITTKFTILFVAKRMEE
jgi:hypothetical protein